MSESDAPLRSASDVRGTPVSGSHDADALAVADVPAFVARLQRLPELSMRAAVAVERLREADDEVALQLMLGIWHGAARGLPGCAEVVHELGTNRPLVDSIGYEKISRLYALAREHGQDGLLKLFLTENAQSLPFGSRKARSRNNDFMASTPLGWRKAHARGTDRNKLDRLTHDRDPAVIALLLDNPRTVERDVVKIAARRPNSATVLEKIFGHPRWIRRAAVRRALVLSPFCPVDISLSLLPQLTLPELRRVVSEGGKLHRSVRDEAARVVRLRQG